MTAQLAIPAIDLKGGRCVRLYQGDPDRETVYGDDPVAMARHWERLGARWLHLVDLDGAFTGNSANRNVIAAIGRAVTIPFQVGGGIRSREDLERMLEAGASRVILGTVMVKQPQLAEKLAVEFGDKLIAGIDAREGLVTVQGWTEQGEIRAVELARRVEQWGVGQIIYTDTEKDGTLSGPNYKGLEQILAASSLKVIVAGGISSLKDLQALKSYAPRVTGVIIG
ncbi:MAG: 1-(5-phosphoribosyl)-5-[(5-phosphoribosylamino)methylideneamino]imidazole-4-carboxamide isomerase, partial [Dethiobacteria bacterium]